MESAKKYITGILFLTFLLISATASASNYNDMPSNAPDTLVVAHHEGEHVVEHQQGESHGTNLAPLLFIILALFVGTATRHLLRESPLPYTIWLLIIGLALGYIDRAGLFTGIGLKPFADSIEWAGHIDPHLILYLFLPTLIFEAAYALHVHTFKKSLGNALILAVPGIMVAIVITAAIGMAITYSGIGLGSWTWPVALMFGSIVSATDPVAVVAILKEVGASKKLATVTESESMLNDGTAIVIFMTLFATVTGTASEGNAVLEFFRVALGGILVGGVIGWLIVSWIKRVFNDALIEITVVIGAAYLTFFVAENIFHVSGVIAVVAFGISMAGPGRTRISPEVSHFLHEFWELAAVIANTLIFIIVGVVIAQRVSFTLSDFIVLLIIYIGVHIARLGTIYLFYPIMRKIGYGLNFKDSIVLWWGGLRGAVALALGLIVVIEEKIPEDIRTQVLTLIAGLVILTSLINATTVKALINWLGLSKIGETKAGLLRQSLLQIKSSGEKEIEKLKENRFMAGANWEKVSEYLSEVKEVVEDTKPFNLQDAVAETRKRLLQKEKESYWRQFSMGLLSSNAVQILSDQIEVLADFGGKEPLSKRTDIEQLWHTPKLTAQLQSLPVLGRFWKRRFFNQLAISYDCARAFVTAQEENLKSLSSLIIGFSQSEEGDGKGVDILSGLEDELNENRITGLTFLRNLKESYPDVCRAIETQLASRSLLNQQQEMVERLKKQGRLEPDEVEKIEATIHGKMKKLMDSPPAIDFATEAMEVLSSTPGLSLLSRKDIQLIIGKSQEKVFAAGSKIYKEGSESDAIYVIIHGSVKAEINGKVVGIFEQGEPLGLFGLLNGLPRRYTMSAESPVSTLRVPITSLNLIKAHIPDFDTKLWYAASFEVAKELLTNVEPYASWSAKKLRGQLLKGTVTRIPKGEKERLQNSLCILVDGVAMVEESDHEFKAPTLLPSNEIRSVTNTIVFSIP